MTRLTDHDAAARAGVSPARDHDVPPVYDGDSALFPKGWDNLDPGRFDADGCWLSFSTQRIFHGGLPYWKATCRHCGSTYRGSTEAEAIAKARRAHGDEP